MWLLWKNIFHIFWLICSWFVYASKFLGPSWDVTVSFQWRRCSFHNNSGVLLKWSTHTSVTFRGLWSCEVWRQIQNTHTPKNWFLTFSVKQAAFLKPLHMCTVFLFALYNLQRDLNLSTVSNYQVQLYSFGSFWHSSILSYQYHWLESSSTSVQIDSSNFRLPTLPWRVIDLWRGKG